MSVVERLNAALSGRYRVERELGEGGMASVYLAEDLKHQRRVALKVLKPELAAVIGAERFLTEIRTTANLQHPHILALFDSGEADGFLYYVMPYVEGETLREKLDRERQLGVEQSVRIARDVADALDYAHRQGVIHRDIKPANILLHDGRPVVADFGIALAVSAAGGGRMTETGMSLGTPHYMSPEQASADRDLSARSDVYSLGCVLYEMLAGQPPHTGPSAQRILVSILTEEPKSVTELRHTVPANVAGAIAKAIEKLPADRFESAKAFMDALDDAAFAYTGGGGSRPGGPMARGHREPGLSARTPPYALPIAAALALVFAAVAGYALGSGSRSHGGAGVVRLDVWPDSLQYNPYDDLEISPDGSMLAIRGRRDGVWGVFLRRFDGDPEFRLVAGTEDALYLDFSPDSRWLAVWSFDANDRGGTLSKVRVDGGGVVTLDRTQQAVDDLVWGRTDEILYNVGERARLVDAAGARAPRDVGPEASDGQYLLPDGSGRLVTRSGEGIFLHDFESDSAWSLVPGGMHPTLVSDDRLLYLDDQGALFVVPFDAARRELGGEPVRIVDRVDFERMRKGYAVSESGILVYRERDPAAGLSNPTILVQGRLSGGVETIPLPPGSRHDPRFSPDGRAVAFRFRALDSDTSGVQTVDLVTGATTSLAGSPRVAIRGVVWSPDGDTILYGTEGALLEVPASGGAAPRTVLSSPGRLTAYDWPSPDTIVFGNEASLNTDVFIASLSDPEAFRPYLQAPWSERQLRVSPDQRHAVFVSNEGGDRNVWIRSWPDPGERWQVTDGGVSNSPLWAPDGSAVYFWHFSPDAGGGFDLGSLYVARVDRSSGLVPGPPQPIDISMPIGILMTMGQGWDLHPDGDRYVATYWVDEGTWRATRYVVVLNWEQEVEALLEEGR